MYWLPAFSLSIPTRHCILHLVWMDYFSYHKWYGFSRYSMDFMSFLGILQANCKHSETYYCVYENLLTNSSILTTLVLYPYTL